MCRWFKSTSGHYEKTQVEHLRKKEKTKKMQNIQLHFKSFNLKLVERVCSLLENQLCFSYTKKSDSIQKTTKTKYTVIRSPHVHKKSREQFQLVEHHRFLSLSHFQVGPLLFLLKSGSFFGIQLKARVKSRSYLEL